MLVWERDGGRREEGGTEGGERSEGGEVGKGVRQRKKAVSLPQIV